MKRFETSGPVIPINDLQDSVPKEEAILRCKLASLYRLVDRYGLTYSIYNHITVRCHDNPSHFLINALGLNYEEVTASNLIKVDSAGNIIDRGTTPYGINKAGFILHSAIHAARSDLHCVIHVHTHAGAAVSTHKLGLLPLSQEAMSQIPFVSYHNYDGILVDEDLRKGIKASLGSKNKILILHNHGLVACGKTVEEAWAHLYDLIYACETQSRVLSGSASNTDNLMLPSKEAQQQVADTYLDGVYMNDTINWAFGEIEFEAEMRYLDYRGYKTGYLYKVKPFHSFEKIGSA